MRGLLWGVDLCDCCGVVGRSGETGLGGFGGKLNEWIDSSCAAGETNRTDRDFASKDDERDGEFGWGVCKTFEVRYESSADSGAAE